MNKCPICKMSGQLRRNNPFERSSGWYCAYCNNDITSEDMDDYREYQMEMLLDDDTEIHISR